MLPPYLVHNSTKKTFLLFLLFLYSNVFFTQTISTSALSGTSFCQNEAIDVDYTITGTYNPGNTFTAQLSDSSGSFTSPTNIGTLASTSAGTISATLPNLMLTGTQYRIRVIADNPAVTGTNNGTNLTITGDTTDPSTFGSNIWNAYCYNIDSYTSNTSSFDYSNYRGMYTQTGESFSSTDLWADNSNPSTATGYSGCDVTNDTHIVQYKRKGFPCNYYTLSIAGPGNSDGHDDAARLLIDGVVVWSNSGCCAARLDVWTGFLGANSEVEFTWSDNGGRSYGRMTFDVNNYPSVTPDVTICAGSSTTLTASGAANYDWSLNSTHLVAPLDSSSVVVSPAGGTANSTETYTVSTYDSTTTCTVSNTIDVTINPVPSTSVTPTTGSYCASGSVDVIASGANTYTWLPATGVTVNSPSGHNATLSPTTTTVYTVTGSNNCASDSDNVTITVTVPPGDPNDFGSNSWDVYCYDGDNFNTYMGMYVHNTLDFDTRDLWGNNSTPSNAPGYSGCAIPTNNHSFRYKRRGFNCGYYQIDIPNHDDRINLIIDGVSVFSQNSWYSNTYKADVWRGYLDANSEIEYTIREFSGGSNGGLAFIYLYGPDNGADETVWNGSVSTDWSDANNWCNGVPNSTINAYIPYNTTNAPAINGFNGTTKDLFIQNGTTLTISGTDTFNVYGNFTKEGTFVANNSTVVLNGSDSITLSSSNDDLSFYNLKVDNSSAIICSTLNNNKVTITNSLDFTNGIIYTGATNTIEFSDDATATGMSNNSFVDGVVSKIGDDAFSFPVGDSSYYASISISAPGVVTDEFTAEYFNTSVENVPYDKTSKEAALDHISECDYWILNRTAGTSNVNVTLSWYDRGTNCIIDDPSSLAVARWDGATWRNHGNGGTTGNTTAGTVITSAAVTNFSPFTLASLDGFNPLPIELISFNAITNGDVVDLTWQTSIEINNAYFTIERSSDGIVWEEIITTNGAGNSSNIIEYFETDYKPLNGISYYRLKQTDFDGQYKYFNIVPVKFINNNAQGISLFPIPVNAGETVNIKFNGIESNEFLVVMRDVKGKNFYSKVIINIENNTLIGLPTEANIPAGVYIITATSENQFYSQKLLIK